FAPAAVIRSPLPAVPNSVSVFSRPTALREGISQSPASNGGAFFVTRLARNAPRRFLFPYVTAETRRASSVTRKDTPNVHDRNWTDRNRYAGRKHGDRGSPDLHNDALAQRGFSRSCKVL